jgi:hypothetical protein
LRLCASEGVQVPSLFFLLKSCTTSLSYYIINDATHAWRIGHRCPFGPNSLMLCWQWACWLIYLSTHLACPNTSDLVTPEKVLKAWEMLLNFNEETNN